MWTCEGLRMSFILSYMKFRIHILFNCEKRIELIVSKKSKRERGSFVNITYFRTFFLTTWMKKFPPATKHREEWNNVWAWQTMCSRIHIAIKDINMYGEKNTKTHIRTNVYIWAQLESTYHTLFFSIFCCLLGVVFVFYMCTITRLRADMYDIYIK